MSRMKQTEGKGYRSQRAELTGVTNYHRNSDRLKWIVKGWNRFGQTINFCSFGENLLAFYLIFFILGKSKIMNEINVFGLYFRDFMWRLKAIDIFGGELFCP